jgi:hypothetical protein
LRVRRSWTPSTPGVFPQRSPDCLDRWSLREQCRRHPEHALLYGFADVWQRPALVRELVMHV